MATRSRLAALFLAVTLSGILAAPVFAMQREGPRRDDPIVRIIKRLLHKFGIVTNEDIAVPKP